jgi:hypothetical protein
MGLSLSGTRLVSSTRYVVSNAQKSEPTKLLCRSWDRFSIGDFFHRHILGAAFVCSHLVHVEHQYITLDLVLVSRSFKIQTRLYIASYIHQAEARRRFRIIRPPPCTERTSRTPRVNKELIPHLICLELMRAAPKKDIDVHLPRGDQQTVWVALWDYRVAVREADAQSSMLDDFREG